MLRDYPFKLGAIAKGDNRFVSRSYKHLLDVRLYYGGIRGSERTRSLVEDNGGARGATGVLHDTFSLSWTQSEMSSAQKANHFTNAPELMEFPNNLGRRMLCRPACR
jgi:hypothetical protein